MANKITLIELQTRLNDLGADKMKEPREGELDRAYRLGYLEAIRDSVVAIAVEIWTGGPDAVL